MLPHLAAGTCPISLTYHCAFILTASEKCQQEKRKTVNGEDILFAMTSLGFENYAEALKIYLSKYREVRLCTTCYGCLSPHQRLVVWWVCWWVGGLVGVLSYAKYSSRLSPPVANTRIGQRAAATMLEGPWADPTRKVDDLVHRLPAAFLKQQITQTIS